MANVNAPCGARAVSNFLGSPWTGRPREFVVDATDANALFIGDIVKPGNVAGATFETDAYGVTLPIVTLAGATETPIGIVVGFKANPNNLSIAYKPALTKATVLVVDDPNVLFEIQTNGTATTAWAYALANIVYGAGSAFYNSSGTQIDSTTVGGTGTVIEIMGLSQRVNNSLGQYASLLCRFKLHAYK